MDFDIAPEPSEAERAAIEEALRDRDPQDPSAYGSAWRRAALEPDDEDYAVALPRSSRGATRA